MRFFPPATLADPVPADVFPLGWLPLGLLLVGLGWLPFPLPVLDALGWLPVALLGWLPDVLLAWLTTGQSRMKWDSEPQPRQRRSLLHTSRRSPEAMERWLAAPAPAGWPPALGFPLLPVLPPLFLLLLLTTDHPPPPPPDPADGADDDGVTDVGVASAVVALELVSVDFFLGMV